MVLKWTAQYYVVLRVVLHEYEVSEVLAKKLLIQSEHVLKFTFYVFSHHLKSLKQKETREQIKLHPNCRNEF